MIEAYGRVVIDTGTTIVVEPEGYNDEATEYTVSGSEEPGDEIYLKS